MMRFGLFILVLLSGIVVDLTPSRQVVVVDQASSARLEVSCSQSAAFLARTSGFSFLQKVQYDAAICHLVSTGTLHELDALYRLAAPNQAASLLNLSQNKYNITVSGGCLYGPEAGWMGDAATCYADTGFNRILRSQHGLEPGQHHRQQRLSLFLALRHQRVQLRQL